MRKITQFSLTTLLMLTMASVSAFAKSEKAATLVEDVIWADGLIYDTVLTTNSFKSPPAHTVDLLFDFSMSGLSGQRPISDSAPGSKDYNGGRWSVQKVVFTNSGLLAHDPDGDTVANFELKSAADVHAHVLLGHIMVYPTGNYFSCPLRGKGQME